MEGVSYKWNRFFLSWSGFWTGWCVTGMVITVFEDKPEWITITAGVAAVLNFWDVLEYYDRMKAYYGEL